MKGSNLDIVFENNKSDINELLTKVRDYVKSNVKVYPFSTEETIYNPDLSIYNKPGRKTLWDNFLEEFLKNRHSIVHGNTLTSPVDHEEIELSKVKIELLLYAFVLSLCKASC